MQTGGRELQPGDNGGYDMLRLSDVQNSLRSVVHWEGYIALGALRGQSCAHSSFQQLRMCCDMIPASILFELPFLPPGCGRRRMSFGSMRMSTDRDRAFSAESARTLYTLYFGLAHKRDANGCSSMLVAAETGVDLSRCKPQTPVVAICITRSACLERLQREQSSARAPLLAQALC